MRRTQKVTIQVVVALALLTTIGCIHKTTGSVTPWERVHTYNASFAEANNAFEQGMEAVVSSGLVSANQAAPLIAWSGQVATLHQQITAILQQGSATTGNLAAVQALVAQIKNSAQALPPSALGIKNPKSQQTFQQDVASIGSLADAILSSLQVVVAQGGR